MSNSHWSRRILLSAIILCLAVPGFGVQPVQASPPERGNNVLSLTFVNVPPEPVCLWDTIDIVVSVHVEYYFQGESKKGLVELIPLVPFPDGSVTGTAKVGALLPARQLIKGLRRGETRQFKFTYTAVSEGRVTLRFDAQVPSGGSEQDKRLVLNVEKCVRKIHATTNVNQVLAGMMTGGPWEPVALYDISGTIQVNEDGSLQGEGTANNFIDALWTGQGFENATCSVSGPREGQSAIELVADPDAWAQEGEIDLQFNIKSMDVNSITLNCCIDGDCNSSPLPGFTIASFGLKFDPLPAQGGTTDLEFHFPAAHVPLQMELIVSPQEAGS